MKKDSIVNVFHFNGNGMLPLVVLIMALMACLYACASTPTDQNKPQPASSQTAQKQTASPQSTAQPSGKTVSPAAEPQAEQTESVATLVTTAKAHLRATPNSKGKIIAKLKKGERVTKLSASGSWLNVELSDKTTGWILKKQTREAK